MLRLKEHHLKYSQLEKVNIEGFKLEALYCRQLCEKGGIAIFIYNNLGFSNIDIVQHCKEQDVEICALLSFGTSNICVLTIYRAPSVTLTAPYLSSTLFFNYYIHLCYTSFSVET
jgi:hypothetical protein